MENIYPQVVIFYYVAHFKSFTQAGAYLNCSKAYVSKQINALERNVGANLFHRNTRKIELSLAGEALLEHAEIIAHEFQYITHTIASLQKKPKGLLRITTPAAYADFILAPHLASFLSQYPEIRIKMDLTGALLNLTDEKIDVAIRLTHEPPLDRVAKRLGCYQMIICAAPAYLKNCAIKTPQALASCSALVYTTEKNYNRWPLLVEGKPLTIEVQPTIAANNSKVLLEAALNGVGVARLPDYVVQKAVDAQRLVPLLSHFYPPPIPIYASYVKGRVLAPKIKVFLTFMEEIHRLEQVKS